MKDLYIIGAGGLGRKLYECIRRINDKERKWNIVGYLDDNPEALKGIKCRLDIVGSIKEYIPMENDVFALGVYDPDLKEKLSNIILEKGGKFETIISPEAIVGDFVDIGQGSVIMTPYNIETGSKIGNFVTILGSTIALDGEIGDYSTSTGFVNLTNAKIGKKVFIGTHAAIMSNVKVGDNARISAGSIVTRDVKENTVVFGYPAREILKR